MQDGYSYELVEPAGKNFRYDFTPQLTPAEMLSMGVFGGIYMRDCVNEFPASWFENAKFAKGTKPDVRLNFMRVDASQPLSVWREKGWIHPDDPRGWFQWYCRYYLGRRHPDDNRQIGRWKAMARHLGQIRANCKVGDMNCRRKQRQAILHWAYDPRLV
jgi:hypothetical protein